MKPLVRGTPTGMVQIPANWCPSSLPLSYSANALADLDDLPPHMFIKDSPNSHGFVDADSFVLFPSLLPPTNSIAGRSSCGKSISSTSTARTTGSACTSSSPPLPSFYADPNTAP